MGFDIFIFIIYFSLFSYILFSYISSKKELGEPRGWLMAFAWKLLLGICYGYMTKNLIPVADTWQYFQNGLRLNYHSFAGPTGKNFNILSGNSYFEYFRYIFMDYLSGFFSLLSGNRYNVNLIFYNFIVLMGIIKLFQFLLRVNSGYKKIFFLVIGFFPPFVFWTSGFHRDGLCIAALGCFLFNIQNYLNRRSCRFLLWALLAMVGMLFLRSFWGFSSIVVAFFWWVSIAKRTVRPIFVFGLGFIMLLLLFTLSGFAPKALNFALFLTEKQHGFMKLTGESELPLTRLNLSLVSFIQAIPQAIDHLAFRPYPKDIGKSFVYVLTFLENLAVWALSLLAIYCSIRRRNIRPLLIRENNVLLFLVIINYLIIGLSVPFLGAIIRYRAPFETLLIIVLVQAIPRSDLQKWLPNRIQIAFSAKTF